MVTRLPWLPERTSLPTWSYDRKPLIIFPLRTLPQLGYIVRTLPQYGQGWGWLLNSSWPGDAIWWQRNGSTLAQVMAWCLMAPNEYLKLECGTWYHHRRRLQCVATWHYRCRHNLKNNCIWDNLQCCFLVPRSSIKPVMLTFDLQSRKV